MTIKPASITANRQMRKLTVIWDDGHESVYSFELLRAGCPCAECRGGHEKMGSEPPPEAFEAHITDEKKIILVTIVPVGSYAITPVWEDGHDYGIYQWAYLRALCPCQVCRP